MYNPKFGVEYTFMVPGIGGRPVESSAVRQNIVNKLIKRGFWRAYIDPGVVEVPSPPHSSLAEAQKFFDRLGKAAGLEGLVPKIMIVDKRGNEMHYCNGGGDVHIELPESHGARAALLEQMIPIMCNRPWLGWVFNHFGDSDNARSLLGHPHIRDYLFLDASHHTTKYERLCSLIYENDYAIRLNNDNKTLEFRMFDAVDSWQQALDHIEFCLALMKYAKKRADLGLSPEKVNKFKCLRGRDYRPYFLTFDEDFKTLKSVGEPFKKLIKVLGLDWKRYSKYMKNFKDRLAFGELV